MREICGECKYHKFFAGTHWCEIYKKHKRIDEVDAHKDVPCYKYDRRKGVKNDSQTDIQGAETEIL